MRREAVPAEETYQQNPRSQSVGGRAGQAKLSRSSVHLKGLGVPERRGPSWGRWGRRETETEPSESFCQNGCQRLNGFNKTCLFLLVPEGEPQDQGAKQFRSWCEPSCRWLPSPLSPHGRGERRKLSGISFYKGTDPIMRTPLHDFIYT